LGPEWLALLKSTPPVLACTDKDDGRNAGSLFSLPTGVVAGCWLGMQARGEGLLAVCI